MGLNAIRLIMNDCLPHSISFVSGIVTRIVPGTATLGGGCRGGCRGSCRWLAENLGRRTE
jgi:hypothetical protein